MSICRLRGCHDWKEAERNSVYRATCCTSAAGTGGMPWATSCSFGFTSGHPPDPLEEPHVFIVFSLETTAGRAGITADAPNAGTAPEAQYIPQDHRIGFIIIPGIGLPWFDPTEPVFTGEPFVTNIDQSFFQGRLEAVIPEAPVDFLSTHATADAAIKQSAAVQRPGYYPPRFHVSYDAASGEHVMAIEGLRLR